MNHSYLWGPLLMFIDCQKFAGLWGHYFVGNWFVALKCKTIHYFVKRSSGCKFIGKSIQQNPRTNNDNSTVIRLSEQYYDLFLDILIYASYNYFVERFS